ncbi:MAG: SOS response-associated peptidase [Methanomicrobium sp.]|nr:SOS response-associated peptidase [Methanomicrobium sp.]
MCGRFALYNIEWFSDLFGVYNPLPQINLSYNISPGKEICAVCGGIENYVVAAEWGIKRRAKSGSKTLHEYSMINTRDDTLKDDDYSLKHKNTGRCLIPANGFYEWKKEGTRKTPFYIQIRDNQLFAFAGIYGTSSSPSDELSYSCSIITTDANTALSGIHDRMPVILDKSNAMNWIDSDFSEPLSLLKSYPSEKTIFYAVGDSVGSVENDGPSLIKQIYDSKWW